MMAARRPGARERLLDTAEGLFAERGYEATSTRDISARSGEGLGTLTYHFRSKEVLLIEVVRRRFDELAEIRREVYRQRLAAAGGVPSLDDAIASMVLPFIEKALSGGQEWASYIRLLGRMLYVGTGSMPAFIRELTDPVARELIGWLRDGAPSASDTDLGYGYQFIIGCMIDSVTQAEHDRINYLTDGACSSFAYEEVSPRLLTFVQAGFRAIVAEGERKRVAESIRPRRLVRV